MGSRESDLTIFRAQELSFDTFQPTSTTDKDFFNPYLAPLRLSNCFYRAAWNADAV